MKLLICCLLFALLLIRSKCVKVMNKVVKCYYLDERSPELRNWFIIPAEDEGGHRANFLRHLEEDLRAIEHSIQHIHQEIQMEEENASKPEAQKYDDLTEEEDSRRRQNRDNYLEYLEHQRQHVLETREKVSLVCEPFEDPDGKTRCGSCVYVEIISRKHSRHGQMSNVQLHECIYGFNYLEEASPSKPGVTKLAKLKKVKDQSAASQAGSEVTAGNSADAIEGKKEQIIFFKLRNSEYHPTCYLN